MFQLLEITVFSSHWFSNINLHDPYNEVDEEYLHAHPIFPEDGRHQPRLSITEQFVGTILDVGREILNTPVLEVQQNNGETTRQRRKRRLSDPGAPSPTAGAGPTRITDKWWLY